MNDPAFADYADGMELPMPEWFDGDFIQAVADVGGTLPGRNRGRIDPMVARGEKAAALRRGGESVRRMHALLKRLRGAGG